MIAFCNGLLFISGFALIIDGINVDVFFSVHDCPSLLAFLLWIIPAEICTKNLISSPTDFYPNL